LTQVVETTPKTALRAIVSARGWVVDGPLDLKVTDSEKIDALCKMLRWHEVDTAKSIDALYGLGDNEARRPKARGGHP
jgi:hypothetical protein